MCNPISMIPILVSFVSGALKPLFENAFSGPIVRGPWAVARELLGLLRKGD